MDEMSWFGGGADLTPFYVFEEDFVAFHKFWEGAVDIPSYILQLYPSSDREQNFSVWNLQGCAETTLMKYTLNSRNGVTITSTFLLVKSTEV